MERLILEYEQSDNCTYFATNTIPIVYQSKKNACSDLETILLKYLIAIEERDLKLNQHEKLIEKTRNCVIKFNGKKGMEKELEKAMEEFRIACNLNIEIFNSVSDQFQFAGQTLYFNSFFEVDSYGKSHIRLPKIYTLDEFFADVE